MTRLKSTLRRPALMTRDELTPLDLEDSTKKTCRHCGEHKSPHVFEDRRGRVYDACAECRFARAYGWRDVGVD